MRSRPPRAAARLRCAGPPTGSRRRSPGSPSRSTAISSSSRRTRPRAAPGTAAPAPRSCSTGSRCSRAPACAPPPERVAQAYLELAVFVRALEGLTTAVRLEATPDPLVALGRPLRPPREPARQGARRPACALRDLTARVPAPRLTVVGSINLDLVAQAERLPRPGETVTGATFVRVPGGKGANQAVAAARLGADVTLIACIGDDDFGREALVELERAGVGLGLLKIAPAATTGVALITVDADGENEIVVAPGANLELRPEDVELPEADGVLCAARDPARDGAPRGGDRARSVLPQRRAGARPGPRRRRHRGEPLRARGAAAPGRRDRGDARRRRRRAARGRGGGGARGASRRGARRRHGRGRRVHGVPRRLAARGPRARRGAAAAPASRARSPPRGSGPSPRCRPRRRWTRSCELLRS